MNKTLSLNVKQPQSKRSFCAQKLMACPGVFSCPDCRKRQHEPGTHSSRPSPASRGYSYDWRKVRAEVLQKSGIPRDEWHLYDVDHNPPYDPKAEPDHRKYVLIPRLHADHSRKTAAEDILRDSQGRVIPKRGRGGAC